MGVGVGRLEGGRAAREDRSVGFCMTGVDAPLIIISFSHDSFSDPLCISVEPASGFAAGYYEICTFRSMIFLGMILYNYCLFM